MAVPRVFAAFRGIALRTRAWPVRGARLSDDSLFSVFLWRPWSAPRATSLRDKGLETVGCSLRLLQQQGLRRRRDGPRIEGFHGCEPQQALCLVHRAAQPLLDVTRIDGDHRPLVLRIGWQVGFGFVHPAHQRVDTLLKQGLTQTVGQLREWKVAI